MRGATNAAAGAMDRSIAIQSRTLSAPNALGEQIPSYTTFATVWGEKTELSGSEQLLAQQLSAVKVTKFRIYWRSDVTNTCRVIVDGETYVVTAVAEIERRRWLQLTCQTVAQ
jgi:SPP1 family predicted phage head-tail adaptor